MTIEPIAKIRKADCCGNCIKTHKIWGVMREHVFCNLRDEPTHKTEVCDEFKEIENK